MMKFVNHSYEELIETLSELNVTHPEIYLAKVLKELGYKRFPYSGLNDIGKDKLVGKAIELHEKEMSLVPVEAYKPKKERMSKKMAPIIKKNSGLESVLRDDLKKVGRGILKGGTETLKVIMYSGIESNLLLPTRLRKDVEFSKAYSVGFAVETIACYLICLAYNPKLILPIALTQISTNFISGIYEYVRSVKKRARNLNKEN